MNWKLCYCDWNGSGHYLGQMQSRRHCHFRTALVLLLHWPLLNTSNKVSKCGKVRWNWFKKLCFYACFWSSVHVWRWKLHFTVRNSTSQRGQTWPSWTRKHIKIQNTWQWWDLHSSSSGGGGGGRCLVLRVTLLFPCLVAIIASSLSCLRLPKVHCESFLDWHHCQ